MVDDTTSKRWNPRKYKANMAESVFLSINIFFPCQAVRSSLHLTALQRLISHFIVAALKNLIFYIRSLHYITLQPITLHYITIQDPTFHYNPLHYIRSENNLSIICTSSSPLSPPQHVSTRLLLNCKFSERS